MADDLDNICDMCGGDGECLDDCPYNDLDDEDDSILDGDEELLDEDDDAG